MGLRVVLTFLFLASIAVTVAAPSGIAQAPETRVLVRCRYVGTSRPRRGLVRGLAQCYAVSTVGELWRVIGSRPVNSSAKTCMN
jgi:hypothetical protein